jgi:hypothetical protein
VHYEEMILWDHITKEMWHSAVKNGRTDSKNPSVGL